MFRKMGPEAKVEYSGTRSWSNGPNGQNKKVEPGLPDNKDAPIGNAWAPNHKYLPGSDAMADEKVPEAASNLPYVTDPQDFDKMTFEKYESAFPAGQASSPVTSPYQAAQVKAM